MSANNTYKLGSEEESDITQVHENYRIIKEFKNKYGLSIGKSDFNIISELHGKTIVAHCKMMEKMLAKPRMSTEDYIKISRSEICLSRITKYVGLLDKNVNNSVSLSSDDKFKYGRQTSLGNAIRSNDDIKTEYIEIDSIATSTGYGSMDEIDVELLTDTENKVDTKTITQQRGGTQMDKNKDLDINKPTLVNYWANWCSASKSFMKKWPEVVDYLEHKYPNMQIIDVDVKNDKKMSDQALNEGVKGFPTLVFYNKGGKQYLPGDNPINNVKNFISKYI